MKKLSVITVTFNNSEDLLKTIESVKEQSNQLFEFIIIDGKSSDNTEEIINENRDIIDLYISEKDYGIYDAMNKGIKLTKGDYLIFLNAGDIFYDKTCVDKVYQEVINNDLDIGYFNVALKSNNNIRIKRQPETFDWKYLLYNNICHQSMIINKKLFGEYGLYNIKNKVFADFEFLFMLIKQNESLKIKGNNAVIVYFDLTGISTQASLFYKTKERFRVILKYGSFRDEITYIILNLFYKPLRYLMNMR